MVAMTNRTTSLVRTNEHFGKLSVYCLVADRDKDLISGPSIGRGLPACKPESHGYEPCEENIIYH